MEPSVTPSTPSTPSTPPTSALLRADMQTILSYIQCARLVSMHRETAIGRIKSWLVDRAWVGIVVALVLVVAVNWLPIPELADVATGLILIMLTARFGAIVSIGRRINDENLGIGPNGDAILTLASLGSGPRGLALALFSANVFGLVIYALFASGLPDTLGLKGGIAPEFVVRSSVDAHDRVVADEDRVEQLDRRVALVCAAPDPAAAPTLISGRRPAGPSDAQKRPGTRATPVTGAVPPVTTTDDGSSSPAEACRIATAERGLAREVAMVSVRSYRTVVEAVPVGATPTTNGGRVQRVVAALGLKDRAGLLKMLIWAFLAGFLEQLVPDMLDSIAARTRQGRQKAVILANR